MRDGNRNGERLVHNEFTAFTERDGEWFVAYCSEIPGANGQGRTKAEALRSLSEAIDLILEDRREDALRGLPDDAERVVVAVGWNKRSEVAHFSPGNPHSMNQPPPDPQAIPPSPFCELVGLETLEVSAEKSVTALTIGPQHANAFGIAHGGAIFTLADRAFGLALGADGVARVSMDTNIRYLRPARIGQRLTATARIVQAGRQTAFYRIDVEDENGRLIACLSGTGHVFEKR